MKARVSFRGDAAIFYRHLQSAASREELQLLRSIDAKVEFISQNPFYGDQVQKRKIPQVYQVQNLWRVELVGYWRMLYTIKGDEVEIICFIIDILDHSSYDKRFGY